MMRPGEIIVDNFAGGGGASTGIFMALGRHPDAAINHDAEAVALHAANHPETRHYCQSVWRADPEEITQGRPVGLAWFSPDCKHFSKAKGGQPVEKNIRDLAWVVVLWAQRVKPRVILLENVEEFKDWGPLIAGADGKLRPCPLQKGLEFRRWVRALKKTGYAIEWRELRACDYGAPTIRKRLFVIARCDGAPIEWPAPTHGAPESEGVRAGRLRPWRNAAEIIDWGLPCPSIFMAPEEARRLGLKRPLVPNSLARIARGVKRRVIDAARPFIVPGFIVPVTHHGDYRVHGVDEPLRTTTTARRGEFALVAAFLAQHNGGLRNGGIAGHAADAPLSTLAATGSQQQVVPALLVRAAGADGFPGRAAQVAAFLAEYYGEGGQFCDPAAPLNTVPTRDRFALVRVLGCDYVIADLGMRMLTPRELYAAQGFPADYRIEIEFAGRRLSKTAQVRMAGNSVCPPLAAALVRANFAARGACAAEAAE